MSRCKLILGVLAVSLVSAFSNLGSYTGGVVEDTGSINVNSNPELKNIKVIIFSSYKDEELKERAKKLGVEEFLIKGERLPKELIVAVKRVLSNSNQ